MEIFFSKEKRKKKKIVYEIRESFENVLFLTWNIHNQSINYSTNKTCGEANPFSYST